MRLRLLLLAISPLLALASPVRSNMGGDELIRIDDSLPQNLWVWPTQEQTERKFRSPNSVWYPEIGTWYVFCSSGGYFDVNSLNLLIDFSDGSVSTSYSSGYSAGAFIPLEPGHYMYSADVDGGCNVRVGFYEERDNGFKWMSNVSLGSQNYAGHYERVFTVPSGCSLALFLPTTATASQDPLTSTNIEIYRID